MRNIFKILIIFVLFFGEINFTNAQNGELFLDSMESVSALKEFTTDVKLKTSGVSINSIQVSLSFDKEKVEFLGYDTKSSTINFWVSPPTITDSSTLNFTGIILGGVSETYEAGKNISEEISLVKLKWRAKENGEAIFNIVDSVILQNDGLGTNFSHTKKSLNFNIDEKIKEINILNAENKEVSQEAVLQNEELKFEVIFIEKSELAQSPDLIFFNVTNDTNGIKEYRIKKPFTDWVSVENPYKVKRGIFTKNLSARVYDYAGNFKEASVSVPGIVPSNYILIFVLIFIAFFSLYKLVK